MKGLFPQYEATSAQNFSEIWKNAIFVFDTNVLLNLYRYQASTREELLKVLEKLVKQVWIPYHVGLEFQRNRLKVILDQKKRFSDVRSTVTKSQISLSSELENLQLRTRHSSINAQTLIDGFANLIKGFLDELEQLEKSQQQISEPDLLKDRIETLFEGRIGIPPKAQEELDEIYKEADLGFKLRIPPGYKDSEKDKDEPDEHLHGGLIYKRKYGDYVIWQQVLDYAKASKSKAVIFITDDGKEDWWRKIESNGAKTIGPRPELIEEARLKSNVESFLMYSPEGFLKYAKEFLEASVSDETLNEVRDLSTSSSIDSSHLTMRQYWSNIANHAVLNWLLKEYGSVQGQIRGFPDFMTTQNGKVVGFEVLAVNPSGVAKKRIRERIRDAIKRFDRDVIDELTLIFIFNDPNEGKFLLDLVAQNKWRNFSSVRILIGTLLESDLREYVFVPREIHEIGRIPSDGQQALLDET